MDMDERLHVEIAFPARGVDAHMVARFRVQLADNNVPRIIIFTYNFFLAVHEFLMLFLILLMHFFYLLDGLNQGDFKNLMIPTLLPVDLWMD